MFTFIHRPFLYFTPLLCLGILLADSYPQRPLYSILFVLILLLAVILHRVTSWRNGVVGLVALAMLCLGSAVLEWKRPSSINRAQEDVVSLVEVEEIVDPDQDWRRAIVRLQCTYQAGEVQPANESVSVLFNSPRVQQGDILAVRLHLIPILNKGNPGEFDSEAFWRRQDVYRMAFVSEEDFKFVSVHESGFPHNFWQSMRRQCKAVLRAHLSPEVAGLAEALILGDKSRLSAQDRAAFSNAGAMHVLAVSGLHVGIVVYLLMFVFGKLPRFLSKTQAHLLALILVWVYAFLTGLSPSVQRAAFMFTLLVLSQTFGRKQDSLNVLFFSAFVLLLIDPLLIYDIGFQLSYLAMLGILTLYKGVSGLIYIRWKWLRKIWEGTAVGIAAQICTVPLTLYYFHQFPNYFALSNLAVMALAAFILGLGILLFAIQFAHWLASLLGSVLSLLLFGLLFTMQWIEDLPAAVATGFDVHPIMVVLMYASLLIFAIFYRSRVVRFGVPIIFLGLFALVQFQRFANWNAHELLVFNHRHPVFAVKHADHIWCFYKDRAGVQEDAARMVSEYAKVYPGEIVFVPLNEGISSVQLDQESLNCTMERNQISVAYGDLHFQIRMGHASPIDETKTQIDMPYLPREQGRISLLDGAYRFVLAAPVKKAP